MTNANTLADRVEGAKYNCSRCEQPTKWNGLCTDCMLAEFEGGDADCDEADDWTECHMMQDGTCMKAGTEECDWECGRLDR